MSLFLRDEYEELSLREKDAVRALKSALVGVLIAPLQLYTLFLILMVILAEEPLRPRYFRYTVAVSIVLALHIPFVAIMIFFLVANYR
jgi:hypothetical protein